MADIQSATAEIRQWKK